MLDKIRTYRVHFRTPIGAPNNLASTHLRNLAWIRYLLDGMGEVEAWAKGRRMPPHTWIERKPDAEMLKTLFRRGLSPRVDLDPAKRRVKLLDDVFGPIFGGKHSRSGAWFGDKLASGKARPSDERLAWIDDLVPGSLKAYMEPPAPLDPWFYDALDYQDAGWGYVFLARAEDPTHFDPAWEELTSEDFDERSPRLTGEIREGMHVASFVVGNASYEVANDIRKAALTALLGEHRQPQSFEEDMQVLHAAKAETEQGATHPLVNRMQAWSPESRLTRLTDAIGAYRLSLKTNQEDHGIATWWLQGAIDACVPLIQREQSRWFYPLPKKVPPLEGALYRLGLWDLTQVGSQTIDDEPTWLDDEEG